jgi:hypothetical protein
MYCSNGEPIYFLVDSNRFTNFRRDLYDRQWNKIPLTWGTVNLKEPMPKPEIFSQMVDVCRKLASGFNFVRVDLYFTAGRLYFGELTFTPGDGMVPVTPSHFGYAFSDLIDIRHYND